MRGEIWLYALAGIDRGFHRAGIRPGNAVMTCEGETVPETWPTTTLIAARHRSRAPLIPLAVAAAVLWLVCIILGVVTRPTAEVHRAALMFHLVAMVVSFSAVLAVDVRGFLWLAGLRHVHTAMRMEKFATPLIWSGLLVLMISGIFLELRLDSPLTLAKLAAVLGLILNGIWLIPLKERLNDVGRAAPFQGFTGAFRQQLLLRFSLSQLCWWTAVLVGFIAAASH
jgi:hypothetical protein